MNSFTLDDTINSRATWGLRITEPPIIPTTTRIVESVTVDGREGTLTLLKGWEDITLTMRAALLGENIRYRFRDIVPAILAAKTVYFSNDNDVYFKIKHSGVGGLVRVLSTLYDFSLTFVCEPFRYWRYGGSIMLTSSPTNITNQGNVFTLPLITVIGTGNGTLTVGGKQTKLNILAGKLTIDSALMECYQGGTAQNNQMQGPFPVLASGDTPISWSGGISYIEIEEPRWRFL